MRYEVVMAIVLVVCAAIVAISAGMSAQFPARPPEGVPESVIHVYTLGGGHNGINFFEFYVESEGNYYVFLRTSNGHLTWVNPPEAPASEPLPGRPAYYGYIDNDGILYYWDPVNKKPVAKWKVPEDVLKAVEALNGQNV